MEQNNALEKDGEELIPSLHKSLAADFLIGAAIEPYQTEGKHAQLLKKHFNSIVAENVMKPALLAPAKDEFFWDDADKIVSFARENNVKLRFHTLVWHNQTASWFFEDEQGRELTSKPADKYLLLERLKRYIRTVGERYRDDIESWDVVNEVIDSEEPDGLRKSKWWEVTGTDYIKTAFRAAREVLGPDARLFINDYNTNDLAKRTALYNLVKDLLAEGVPIDGIGHQMHINLEWPSTSTIAETIDLFAGLGLDNKVTEMDISLYTNNTDKYQTIPAELLTRQGYRYQEVFDVFKRKKDKLSQVITWGIADDHTWKNNFPIKRLDLPLLFDKQHEPKSAFWGIVDPGRMQEVE